MPYIKDGVYPIHEQQIREAHPNTSFPYPMELHHVADFGYALVHEISPTFNPSVESVVEGTPVLVAGQWKQTWVVSTNPDAPPIPNPRISEIKTRLDQIDIESIRALRAKSLGKDKLEDITKLNTLDSEAEALRLELTTTPILVTG